MLLSQSRRPLSVVILCLTLLEWAQSCIAAPELTLDIPSTWASPAFTNESRDERIQIAYRAMFGVYSNITSDGGVRDMQPYHAAVVLSSLVLADHLTDQSKFEQSIIDTLIARGNATPGFLERWAQVCISAYQAYSKSTRRSILLDLAISAWGDALPYVISSEHASSGKHPKRNAPIKPSCNGTTIAGGVFHEYGDDHRNNLVTGADVAALFVIVSTHLAEITGKKTYSDAASLSTNFLQHHMLTTENGVLQSLDVGNCTLNTLEQKSIAAATAYAFSVVADMTKDQSQLQLSHTLLVGSMKTTGAWNSPDGVVQNRDNPGYENQDEESAMGDKGIYIQLFYEPWVRNKNNMALSALIEAYVAVQYNALRSRAASLVSDYYGPNWHEGPRIDYWTIAGVQASTPLLALSLFPGSKYAAPDISSSTGDGKASSTSSGSSTAAVSSTNVSPTPKSPKLGLIIGAALGGVGAVAIFGLGLFCLLRRASRRATSNTEAVQRREVMPEETPPFLTPEPQIMEEISGEPPTMTAKRAHRLGHAAHHAPGHDFINSEDALGSVRVASGSSVHEQDARGSNVPVSDLVELVYQRMQQEHGGGYTGAHLPAYTPPAK